jgi:hypothetical protein
MPDPLEPGHIPGQNPATPERMPGHTRLPPPRHRRLVPLLVIATLIGVAALYALGVIGH